jgi:hypothetical protein
MSLFVFRKRLWMDERRPTTFLFAEVVPNTDVNKFVIFQIAQPRKTLIATVKITLIRTQASVLPAM